MPDREPALAELCRPLSAKVMPRSAMWAIGGREMTEEEALQAQRCASASWSFWSKKKARGRSAAEP